LIFSLLVACSSFGQITDMELSRVSQLAVGGTSYSAVMGSEGGCWQDGWLTSTLGGIPSNNGYSMQQGEGGLRDDCQELGLAWSGTEALDELEDVPLLFEDRVSSYPVMLSNWPTAQRTLQAVDPLGGQDLSARSVRFVLDGPGELNPQTQVSLLTASTLWELPAEGGEVIIEERAIEITFPQGIESPIELRFEQAWPVEVLQNELGVEVSFFPGEDGQIIAL
jgi:hypothetical protein